MVQTIAMLKKAIIVGAGPAGLTAAYELLKRTDIIPVILEKSGDIGGISKTVNYKGNRMDIGGHRFFSKSDRVMEWWLNIMPIQPMADKQFTVTYQRHSKTIKAEEPFPKHSEKELPDKVMLVRKRLSRIYFLRKFFTYPIQLSLDTLRKLGLTRTLAILVSYLRARLFPRKPEKNLEDFFINRFGDKLYRLFFKDYTEKVWGMPCTGISAEWGAQRIKGISIARAIAHAVKSMKPKVGKEKNDIGQKGTETSLIENFLYPKFGPGQLWEEVARQVKEMGGQILMNQEVKSIRTDEHTVTAIEAVNTVTNEISVLEGDYFFSTMPVQELIAGMNGAVPENVQEVASGLQYRDFITVGVLLKKMPPPGERVEENSKRILPDTWIYIQEKDVKVGRLQIFNNWSPYMVKDPDTVWVGMEYFCYKGDEFWSLTDQEIQATAIAELEKMGLADVEDALDSTVLRMEKTYPAYFGSYQRFEEIRAFTDNFENLFLVGRNGMHKYNNSDHSMLTAMVAVDNIIASVTSKANIWEINTEQEYHEEKKESGTLKPESPLQEPASINDLPSLQLSFKDYLFQTRSNKLYLWLAAIALVVQFAIFKYFYPYASFINGDSYAYLETAYFNFSISTYPVGYSNFLRLFSVFTKSDTALIAFQYLLLQGSILSFLFTLFYFYRPGRIVQRILLAFMVLNPVFLYLANYVSSDTLFLSLSIIWFTLLLWIVYRPTGRLVLIHGVVLFLAFTVRYNALFYPLIAILAFALSKQRILMKLAGTALAVALIGCFALFTSYKYEKLTGIRQFSPFTGWQLANNALYAYRYIDSRDRKPVPKRFTQLDKMVNTYFDTTRDIKKYPQEAVVAGTVYMWDRRSPLQLYMNKHFTKDSTANPVSELKNWASFGPLYADYGKYLIRQYPITFLQHYIWPNTMKYYAPPVEFLEEYSTGKDSVNMIAQAWFNYKSKKITSRFKSFKVSVLDFFPIMAGSLNVVFLFGLLGYILLQGYQQQPIVRKGVLLVSALWLVNFGFSVFASPIALRFQLFPIIISISYASLFIEYIARAATKPEIKPVTVDYKYQTI